MRAALPMYDLPEVADETRSLWHAVRRHLVARGASGVEPPVELERPRDLHRSWQRSDLLLSQACGYPLVRALGEVVVVGTLTHADDEPGRPGWYRSVVVMRGDDTGDAEDRWEHSVAAINGGWSLTGWISLLAATTGRAPWPGEAVVTGSHRASLAALRAGAADVTSIDAVTYGLLAQHSPADLAGLATVSRGPVVPTLPLITAAPERLVELRAAIGAAVADPDLAPTLERLRITGFVALDREAYAGVAELAATVVGTDPPWP